MVSRFEQLREALSPSEFWDNDDCRSFGMPNVQGGIRVEIVKEGKAFGWESAWGQQPLGRSEKPLPTIAEAKAELKEHLMEELAREADGELPTPQFGV